MQDYFGTVDPKTPVRADSAAVNKMAPESSPESLEGTSLTHQDLHNLGNDLKSYFDSTLAQRISPIAQQLSNLAATLKDVSTTAEAAMELGLAVQNDTRKLQQSEQQLSLKVAALETQLRATN